MILKEAVTLAFDILEETHSPKWSVRGNGTKDKLIEAFSQREIPIHTYLGYAGSDGLRHTFARAIPNNGKPKNARWEDWVLSLVGMRYCTSCKEAVDSIHICDIRLNEIAGNRSATRLDTSVKIQEYLLAHPCEICGEKDPVVLEFDHLDPTIKSYNIADRSNRTWSTVLKEIKKCRVLCANCHKRHTAKTQGHLKFKLTES